MIGRTTEALPHRCNNNGMALIQLYDKPRVRPMIPPSVIKSILSYAMVGYTVHPPRVCINDFWDDDIGHEKHAELAVDVCSQRGSTTQISRVTDAKKSAETRPVALRKA